VTPAISREGGGGGECPTFTKASQNVATTDMLLDTLPPSSTEGVDRLYCQLGEILTIVAAQQAECSC
jgi:hypothetical protein